MINGIFQAKNVLYIQDWTDELCAGSYIRGLRVKPLIDRIVTRMFILVETFSEDSRKHYLYPPKDENTAWVK